MKLATGNHDVPLNELIKESDPIICPSPELVAIVQSSERGQNVALDRNIVPLLNALVERGITPVASCEDYYVMVKESDSQTIALLAQTASLLPQGVVGVSCNEYNGDGGSLFSILRWEGKERPSIAQELRSAADNLKDCPEPRSSDSEIAEWLRDQWLQVEKCDFNGAQPMRMVLYIKMGKHKSSSLQVNIEVSGDPVGAIPGHISFTMKGNRLNKVMERTEEVVGILAGETPAGPEYADPELQKLGIEYGNHHYKYNFGTSFAIHVRTQSNKPLGQDLLEKLKFGTYQPERSSLTI